MRRMIPFIYEVLFVFFVVPLHAASVEVGPYSAWGHTGTFFILTTPEGVDLPAGTSIKEFPLLVRLHRDFFDFSQAKPRGEDIRFSDASGVPMAYQIEEWDAANGTAAIWVRIPAIHGQERQAIRMHWNKADATGESSGAAVFNASNGYLSVWHMNDPLTDAAGMLTSKDTGTLSAVGVIGSARRFPGERGIFCGDAIASFPLGAEPHSSEAWFRTEVPNATLLGWGEEKNRGGKVRIQLRSPLHLNVDSFFENVVGKRKLAPSTWTHMVHTYGPDGGKVYINGELDGTAKPKLNIPRPARMWIGGWYNNYDFVGELDEVRVSRVARSPEWVKLQYENQKPLQTLVGHLVQPGNAFSLSAKTVEVSEGKQTTVTAEVGGAQKVYWILNAGAGPQIVAVDRRTFNFDSGRVAGNTTVSLQCRAIFPEGAQTQDVSITIKEAIADPVVSLTAPAEWDGRRTIEVVANIANLAEMQAQGAPAPTYDWSVTGPAVTKEIAPGSHFSTKR